MAELKIKADSGGGTVSLKGPATTTSNAAVQLTLPVDDGAANTWLKSNGSGVTSWAAPTATEIATSSGTAGSGTFLRGDNTWAAVSGSKWTDTGSDIYRNSKVAIGDWSSGTIDDQIHSKVSSGTNYIRFETVDGGSAKEAKVGVNGSGDLILSAISDTNVIFAQNNSENSRIDTNGTWRMGQTATDEPGYGNTTNGCSIVPTGGTICSARSGGVAFIMNRNSSDGAVVALRREGSTAGWINVASNSVTYATSSDYRLKENEVSITNGITKLKQLKPYRFNWKNDSSKTLRDGFFAHEVSSVVPEAINGTKDQVVTQADVDSGEFKSSELNDPRYQSIDQSKLVPLLTAALQEAITKIETLETKVAALEAG